jgi:hypothetical protein
MYHNPNRSLMLVASNLSHWSQNVSYELSCLHNLLYQVEHLNTYATVNEIIDINKYKVIRKKHLVMQILRAPYLKPFQFVCCKN